MQRHATASSRTRHSLEREVPSLGGVPRKLVATEQGRRAVEKWLRSSERNGIPGNGAARWLDLDCLRRELGMTEAREGFEG